jgi:hypothetical protein
MKHTQLAPGDQFRFRDPTSTSQLTTDIHVVVAPHRAFMVAINKDYPRDLRFWVPLTGPDAGMMFGFDPDTVAYDVERVIEEEK